MEKVNISIEDNNTCTIITEIDGRKIKKHADFKTLLDLLNSSLDEGVFLENNNAKGELSSILPGDNIISTVQTKHFPETNSTWYILLREPVPVNMKYNKKGTTLQFKKCGMPKILFAVKMFDKKCVKLRIACVKDQFLNEDTVVYRYPFSNVFNDGSVCLGQNPISSFFVSELNKIVMIPEMFLDMINNEDGYAGANSSGLSHIDFLKSLENKEFNEDHLKEQYLLSSFAKFVMSLD